MVNNMRNHILTGPAFRIYGELVVLGDSGQMRDKQDGAMPRKSRADIDAAGFSHH